MRVQTRLLLFPIVIGLIHGCGSFESVLPDREKEYKYSSEIPPLEVPPELSTSTIEKSPIRPLTGGEPPASEAAPGEQAKQPRVRDEVPESKTEPQAGPDVERSPDDAYISIKEKFPIAWRMVGRALSRLEIEVEDLNRSDGLYYIIFEDKRNRADDSIWSSLAFWSSSGANEEQRFRVLVDAKSETAEVRILNEDGQVLSEGTGLDLLRRIQNKINEQTAEK